MHDWSSIFLGIACFFIFLVILVVNDAALAYMRKAKLPDAAIVSDYAPQFRCDNHALCWVHMERQYAKMIGHSDDHRLAIEWVRSEIARLYRDLKSYREFPNPESATHLQRRLPTYSLCAPAMPAWTGSWSGHLPTATNC